MALAVQEPVSSSLRLRSRLGRFFCVIAFNRMSLALWWLEIGLSAICRVFYDVFPLLEPEWSASVANNAVQTFLSILGWRFARTGRITLSNKEGRLERILSLIEVVKGKGPVTKSEAAVIHGLLNFATNFFQGRELKLLIRAFYQLSSTGSGDQESQIIFQMQFYAALLARFFYKDRMVGRCGSFYR